MKTRCKYTIILTRCSTCKSLVLLDIQRVLKIPSKVSEDIPISHSTIHDLENDINLNLGSVPSIIKPYKFPHGQKNEMEQMVKPVTEKSAVQAMEDHIKHRQTVLQILNMSKNMINW